MLNQEVDINSYVIFEQRSLPLRSLRLPMGTIVFKFASLPSRDYSRRWWRHHSKLPFDFPNNSNIHIELNSAIKGTISSWEQSLFLPMSFLIELKFLLLGDLLFFMRYLFHSKLFVGIKSHYLGASVAMRMSIVWNYVSHLYTAWYLQELKLYWVFIQQSGCRH